VSSVTVSSGGTVELVSGVTLPPGVKFSVGGILALGPGEVFSGFTVTSGLTLEVLSGGTDFGAIVSGGGTLVVGSGGTDSGTTILKGGSEKVSFGGTGINTSINGGGTEIAAGGIASDTVVSSGGALVVSSGGVADPTTILKGGSETVSAHGTDLGAQVSGGKLVILSGGIAAVLSGGTAVVSAGGTAIVTTSIDSGGLLQTANGGTAIVSGTVFNSGTLIASGSGSLVEIITSAVVSGGAVEVGNGVVDVLSGGTANIRFLSNGSGGLEIADTQNSTSAFTGAVSGFGGVNHANHKQFIDLVSVTSAAHTISFGYTSGAGSGTLTVSSAGQVVASIELIGAYTSANFSATAGVGGTVKITDPGVVNGGRIELGAVQAFPWLDADVSNIAFGAQTTLAFSENTIAAGASLGVTDGRHAATIALLGNYMAGSFATTAGDQGVTLVSGTPQSEQPLLTHPPHR
jgi:autotransporter passenger strand-loop-strand repeat protein